MISINSHRSRKTIMPYQKPILSYEHMGFGTVHIGLVRERSDGSMERFTIYIPKQQLLDIVAFVEKTEKEYHEKF